ncbi:lineage-specific thermal regulator protein [compost metagenome]
MYGKEIIDSIEARFNSLFKPSHGLIYPILRKLESEKLLTAHWEGDGEKKTKRYYRITDEGRAALLLEADNFKPAFMQTYFFFNNVMKDLYTAKGGKRYDRPIDSLL